MGLLGDLGWEMSSHQRPRLLHDQDLVALRSMMLPETTLDVRELYPKRKTLALTTLQGEEAYRVRLVNADGVAKMAFFSVESGLPLADKGVASLGIGPMPYSITYGDYREVAGGQVPFQVIVTLENIRTEMLVSEFFVTADDPAPPALPLPIQALVAMGVGEDAGEVERPVAETAVVPPEAAAVHFALGDRGEAVPAVGDLDGDGKEELVFAVLGGDDPSADRILVFDGPFAGEVGNADAFAGILGGGARLAGDRPLAATDMDGDGIDDLATLWDLGDDGVSLCLVHGPITGGERGTDACDAWFTFPRGASVEGGCLHGAGDVTGDGRDDLLVGDPARDVALVLPGKAERYAGTTVLAAAAVVELTGKGGFGARFAVADVNADGADDLWIAAPDLDDPRADAGAVHLFLGPIGPDSAAAGPASTLHAGLSRIHAGRDLDAGGDLDGDGERELLVLAAHSELGGDAIVLEPWPAIDTRELAWMTTRIAAVALNEPIRRVTTAGDVDGDGYADVLLGVPGAEEGAGRAYLVYGPLTHAMTLTEAPVLFTSPGAERRFGAELLPLGDMNEDGRDDLLIVASEEPAAYLFLGAPRPADQESPADVPAQTSP
jgi:hypothetical protein